MAKRYLVTNEGDYVRNLIKALEFYADEKRYAGPNQRFEKPDEYQPEDVPYLLDVTRDGGSIARKALGKA